MKSISLLLIFVIILGGCNLPVSKPPESAIPTMILDEPTKPSITLIVETPTQIPTPPSADAPTPQPPILTPIPVITSTISAGTTTSIPTANADIRETLGKPAFVETFDSGVSFGLDGKVYDDENTLIKVEDGKLKLTSRYANGYHGWRTGGRKVQNGYFEGTFKIGACGNSDLYGMIVRSQDFVKGYWLQISCGGDWAFISWNGNTKTALTKGANVQSFINTGEGQTNRIGFQLSGNSIKAYVNGKLLTETNNGDYPEPGALGAFIAASATPNFTVEVEDFSYWSAP